MKLKLKLDKDVIVQFLLEHGEKFVVAAFVAGFLMLVYNAVLLKSYAPTPDELKKSAVSASNHIKKTPPNAPPECQAPDYSEIIELSRVPTKVEWLQVAGWLGFIGSSIVCDR